MEDQITPTITEAVDIPGQGFGTASTQEEAPASQPTQTPQEAAQPISENTESILPSPPDKPKHPGGRPCKFCENKDVVMQKVAQYFERTKDVKDGKARTPWLEELALELDVDDDTITLWAQKKIPDTDTLEHPEFFGAYKKIKTLQKLRLQQKATGRYNAAGSIFLLKANHGMIETEKQILTGGTGNEPLEIRIIEDTKYATKD